MLPKAFHSTPMVLQSFQKLILRFKPTVRGFRLAFHLGRPVGVDSERRHRANVDAFLDSERRHRANGDVVSDSARRTRANSDALLDSARRHRANSDFLLDSERRHRPNGAHAECLGARASKWFDVYASKSCFKTNANTLNADQNYGIAFLKNDAWSRSVTDNIVIKTGIASYKIDG